MAVKTKTKRILGFFVRLIAAASACAQTPPAADAEFSYSFTKNNQLLTIADHVDVWFETTGALGIDEVRKAAFRPSLDVAAAEYVPGKAVWLRFSITSGYSEKQLCVLDLGKEYGKPLDIYVAGAGHLERYQADRYFRINNWTNRLIAKRDIAVIELLPEIRHQVFIHIDDAAAYSRDISAQSVRLFYARSRSEQIPDLLIIGVFIALFAYNLVLLLGNPEKSTLYYILTLLSYLIYLLSDYSNILELLLPETLGFITARSNDTAIALCLLFLVKYSDAILSLKERFPVSHKVAIGFALGIGLFMVGAIARPNSPILAAAGSALQVSVFVCLFIIGFNAARKGIGAGRYFIAAWSAFFTATVLAQIYSLLDIHPVPQLIKALPEYAAAVPAILLSFPLGNRIRKLKNDAAVLELEKDQLKSIDAAKTRFLAAIAHEIKTPLNLILAPCEDIMQGVYGPSLPHDHKILKIIHSNTTHLHRSFNNILSFFRLENAPQTISRQAIDPSKPARQVAIQFDHFAAKNQVGIVINNALPEGSAISFDPALFSLLLINLVSNAVKYNREGGTVTIELARDGSRAVISIKDTGIGIQAADREKIFQPFVQLQGNGVNPEGTGIGLSIVKRIVELHGADLELESAVGVGTTFRLKTPLTVSDIVATDEFRTAAAVVGKARNQTETAVPRSSAVSRRTILVMEDNRDLAEYLETRFSENFDIRIGQNGKAALAWLDEGFRPEIIISDLMAPVMDGKEFHDAIKKRKDLARIPFLFLTAIDDRSEIVGRLAAGAVDYIVKPFDPAALEAKIVSLISLTDSMKRLLTRDQARAAVANREGLFAVYRITKREREVVELLLMGKSQNEIASILNIAAHTAKRHRENIYEKLKVASRYELYNLFNPESEK